MGEGIVYVCESCGVEVDPAHPEVVRLVQWMKLNDFEGSVYVEGMGAYFHRRHAPKLSLEWREPTR